jgi:hypothetical protein
VDTVIQTEHILAISIVAAILYIDNIIMEAAEHTIKFMSIIVELVDIVRHMEIIIQVTVAVIHYIINITTEAVATMIK